MIASSVTWHTTAHMWSYLVGEVKLFVLGQNIIISVLIFGIVHVVLRGIVRLQPIGKRPPPSKLEESRVPAEGVHRGDSGRGRQPLRRYRVSHMSVVIALIVIMPGGRLAGEVFQRAKDRRGCSATHGCGGHKQEERVRDFQRCPLQQDNICVKVHGIRSVKGWPLQQR